MKKFIALVLIFVLTLTALSGCILEKKEPEESANELHFQLESLPDIGEFSLNKKAEYFFSDGAQSVFEPRDDYGALIPYYGGIEHYVQAIDEKDKAYTTYKGTYGFMTKDGKIITDSLWSSYQYYDFDENSGIFYLDSIGTGDNADVIASDGSWKIEAADARRIYPLFSFGQPMFMLGDGSECKIYSLDGSEVLDISRYVVSGTYSDEEGEKLLYPFVVYADENIILLSTVSEHIPGVYIKFDKYIAIDYNGNMLYSFSAEDSNLSYLGGRLLERTDYPTFDYSIMNVNGQTVSPEDCKTVCYSKADNIALAVQEEEGKLLLSWFNADGELTGQKTFDEAYEEFSVMSRYPPTVAENGLAFFDYENGRVYNIFAEPINFPVPESEINRVMELYYDDSNPNALTYDGSSYHLYYCVFTSDGRSLVCKPNGELLFETQPPKVYKTSSYADSDITEMYVRNGYVLSLTEDNMLYAYPLSGGEVISADVSAVADELGRFYAFDFDKTFAVIDISRDNYWNRCIYSFKENRIIHRNMESHESFAGFYLLCTKTYTAVLSADGEEMIRLPLGGLV